jgi:O-antigen/teichoic acid export membrane protein
MKRLSRNFLALLGADMIRRLLGFVSVAFLARMLGKGDFGAINLGFAVLAYSMVLGAAGFPLFGTRQIAKGESHVLVSRIFGSRLITAVSALLAVGVCVKIIVSDQSLAWLIILFSCAVLPQALFLDWFFQGKERMEVVSAARVLQAAVYLLVVLIFVRSTADVYWVAVGAIAGECAAAALMLLVFRRKFPEVPLRPEPSMKLFRQSFSLAIGIVISTLIINYPPIALGAFNTTADVGVYSAANKFVYFMMMGDRILLLLLIPASARKHSAGPESLRRMMNDTIGWILLPGIPLAVGGMLVADGLVSLIFGAEYYSAAAVLRVLIWYFLLTMLHTTFTSGLIGAGGEKTYGKVMAATAVFYLVFVSAGTFWFGIIGTAFGVVVAEGFSVLLISYNIRSYVKIDPPRKLPRILLATVVMVFCVEWMLQYGLFAAIAAGVIGFAASALLLRIVSRKDYETLRARF